MEDNVGDNKKNLSVEVDNEDEAILERVRTIAARG